LARSAVLIVPLFTCLRARLNPFGGIVFDVGLGHRRYRLLVQDRFKASKGLTVARFRAFPDAGPIDKKLLDEVVPRALPARVRGCFDFNCRGRNRKRNVGGRMLLRAAAACQCRHGAFQALNFSAKPLDLRYVKERFTP